MRVLAPPTTFEHDAVETHAAAVADDPSARELAMIQEAFDRAMKQIDDAS